MDFRYCEGELHIFEEGDGAVHEENAESIVDISQSKPDQVDFVVGEDWVLESDEDGYGNKIYTIKKKTEENR